MKNEKQRETKYFSMFTGVGGFELGIGDRAECVGFSEIDKFARELLRAKWPNIKNYGDATKLIPQELPDFELLVGGFPCQAFSLAGKRKGLEDTRGTLFYDIARVVKVKRPKYLLLENVKGLLSHDGGKTFATILTTFSELGYAIQWMVLNSKFFGVPQNRERVFIIGSLRGERIPEILPLEESTSNSSQGISKGQGSPTLQASYGKRNARGPHIIHNIYGGFGENKVRKFKKYSPTIRTPKGGGHLPMVKTDMKIRRLTPTECERLQGFPDGWTEGFSDTQRYKMMGNAVTVNVVQAIAGRFFK